jgi:hypothetical protein
MTSYFGTFESHVTVRAESPERVKRFRDLCRANNLKCILIELAQGLYHSQPMTTTHHQGSLENAIAEARAIAQYLGSNGFEVTRVKVEADPTTSGVPRTEEEASRLAAANYFEFHLLVTLARPSELPALSVLCAEYNAHLSMNTFKQSAVEETERFVTMRLKGMGGVRASKLFDNLAGAIERAGYRTSRRVQEYVVYDTNLTLDDGWMTSPAALNLD